MLHFFNQSSSRVSSLDDLDGTVSLAELTARVLQLSALLVREQPSNRVVGVLAENSVEWIIADLAIAQSRLVSIPIPPFFTSHQTEHLLRSNNVGLLLVSPKFAESADLEGWNPSPGLGVNNMRLLKKEIETKKVFDVSWFGKLTFTSGSTAAPKPVFLSNDQQWTVARSLALALGGMGIERHLCMLPFSILLENVAGLYTSLLLGSSVFVASPSTTGFQGSSKFDVVKATAVIKENDIQSVIFLPEMLKALVEYAEAQDLGKFPLKMIAVGGAKVSPELIERAQAVGLPVFEGYGLSEAGSVVSLNLPSARKVGTVGKPLPHVDVSLAEDSEIILKTHVMNPYNGRIQGAVIPTGDLGLFDSDGYLSVLGRKKNLLITSFGRNVSPEWPEATLTSFPCVAQAFVFGDGQPALSALLVPVDDQVDTVMLETAVRKANRVLPDYARIAQWYRCDEPFSIANGLLTSTGKPRRVEIMNWLANNCEISNSLQGDCRNDVVLSDA